MKKNLKRTTALLCLSLLTACAQPNPTEQDITRNLDKGCTLVSHEKFVKVAEDAKGFKQVSTKFQADCTAEGGTIKRRIAGTMLFDQWQDWFSKSWSYKSRELSVDRVVDSIAKKPESASSKLVYSDGPECNAKIERVATQVAACFQEFDPKSAAYLTNGLDQFKQHSRLFGITTSENAALIQLEDRCTEQLSILLRQLPTDEKSKVCLAKR